MENENDFETAYDKHQLEWMVEHGVSLNDLITQLNWLINVQARLLLESKYSIEADDEILDLPKCFCEFEDHIGFDGSIWTSYNDFELPQKPEPTLAEQMHMLACPGTKPVLEELDLYLDVIREDAAAGKRSHTFDTRLGGRYATGWDKVSCCKVRDALVELGFSAEVAGYPAMTTVWKLHVAW